MRPAAALAARFPQEGIAIARALEIRFDGFQQWPAGDCWAFTDNNPRSITWGMTFYMAPGSTLDQVRRRLDEKRQDELEAVA